MLLEATKLHPAVPVTWWWWLVCLAILAAAVGLAWLGTSRWRALRRMPAPQRDDSLERLKASTLSALDTAADEPEPAAQALLVGAALRRFAGIALDAESDYQTAGQLRVAAVKDPRLIPVAEAAARVDRLAFIAPSPDEASSLLQEAKQVVTSWR